jgi:hypothetical protein
VDTAPYERPSKAPGPLSKPSSSDAASAAALQIKGRMSSEAAVTAAQSRGAVTVAESGHDSGPEMVTEDAAAALLDSDKARAAALQAQVNGMVRSKLGCIYVLISDADLSRNPQVLAGAPAILGTDEKAVNIRQAALRLFGAHAKNLPIMSLLFGLGTPDMVDRLKDAWSRFGPEIKLESIIAGWVTPAQLIAAIEAELLRDSSKSDSLNE